ncbi:MAG: TGS domain-containing protein [Candidatus Latescibacterota bacterium]|nr:MAG: TGS domain-containing protein [Candidatus Latescibacterota bacterium]
MPTNVTPEYKKAKEAFQRAKDPAERLSCLKEMLRLVPKHKGTEHLQAEIKTRIKQLTEEIAGPKKGGARTGPVHTIQPDGAAQVALIGPPNTGKSSLHDHLTGSHAEVGPYPHTTNAPLPGMFAFEDISFQLVDLPPISASFMEPWMPNALQLAHAALLIVDLSIPGCVENTVAIRNRLEEKRISLVAKWRGTFDRDHLDAAGELDDKKSDSETAHFEDDEEIDDTFRIRLPTMLVASKSDLEWDRDEIDVFEELIGVRYPAVSISLKTGEGLDRIGPLLFQGLGIVRVYTKIPGRPADKERPYTLFYGETVHDVAALVHRDLAESLKFARIWGSAKFDGQQVGKDHVVRDGDIIELHG